MKFRFNLLAIILLFFIGSVLAAQYHTDEQNGDASMRAGLRSEAKKDAARHDAADAQHRADSANRRGDRSMDRAKEAWHNRDNRGQDHHEREANRHYAEADSHQRAANGFRQEAADHRDDAHHHFSNAEAHFQNAIDGRKDTANRHYGGTYDAGHAKAIDVVRDKRTDARDGKRRN